MSATAAIADRLREQRSLWTATERAVRRAGMATSGIRILPDFLLIGTKRGGTTSLSYSLLEHPRILPLFPSATVLPLREHRKGVHYFDTGWSNGPRWYRSHFPTRPYRWVRQRLAGGPVLTGEASPYYLYRPGVAERCHSVLPEAKILVSLRDPVERAYSHYKEQRRRGMEPLETFEEAVEAEPGRLAGEHERLVADPFAVSFSHENQSYVDQGRYAPALRTWIEQYGSAQVLVLFSEDFYADPAAAYGRVCRFLGIPTDFVPSLRRRNATEPASIAPSTRAMLRDRYADADQDLAALLGTTPPWRR